MATTDYAACLQLSLTDLADQDKPNYLGTSKKFRVDRRTLRERFLGRRRSRKEAIAEYPMPHYTSRRCSSWANQSSH